MKTNWTQLAYELGSANLQDNYESGGTEFAQKALEKILGKSFIINTIEHILAHKKGSEIALNTLSLLRSEVACCYLYEVFQTSTENRKSDAVWLIKHITHPVCVAWIEDFLHDETTAIWGLGCIDQLLWKGEISFDERVLHWLNIAETKYSNRFCEQIQWIKSFQNE